MTTKCQGSVHLWLFLLVMTFAGLASLTLLSLNAAKGNSTPLETGFGGRFDKLLGVNSDGSGRHARSFPWDPDPRDDNTNPDEPNPRILIRVPRRDTLWETLFGRAFGRRDGSDTARNTAPRPQALTNDTVIQHPKARSKRAPRRMRHRPRKHHRSRARKQYVVNGKVYGQKARLEEGATEPPPRVIDRLQHMRRRFRKPKKQRHQRRKKKKGKRKKKKKKKAKKSRKQLLNEMIKRQKAKKKSKPNFRGRASAKYARHQKRFRSKKMKRKRYRPATYRVAVRKPKKEPWKQRRKWTPKVIKRRKQRRRRPIKEGYRRRKQKKRYFMKKRDDLTRGVGKDRPEPSKPNVRGRASAKPAKRFRSKKKKRKRYRPTTYRVAVRKPKKEPWKKRRKWTPKVIKRRKPRRRRKKQRRRRPIKRRKPRRRRTKPRRRRSIKQRKPRRMRPIKRGQRALRRKQKKRYFMKKLREDDFTRGVGKDRPELCRPYRNEGARCNVVEKC
ncbi:serine/arginine repetitive matrix protein 1-like isoform X1 [Patiria miniata]|uniref:Uncharacterized protein n=1 Tax=Patiria miniata TaxID=46514 RepID=A0A913ZM38_PATMI|nr:serine/arginine repetitive matrix protein 1-like isoform X1 [Patiria miniata]